MNNNHHSISAETISLVAERSGAREIDVKRVVLGLPVHCDRGVILSALARAGVDREFLDRLSGAPRASHTYMGRPAK
jgi:hypothetical protein